MKEHATHEEKVISKAYANAIADAVDLKVQDYSTAFKTWKDQNLRYENTQQYVNSAAEGDVLPF